MKHHANPGPRQGGRENSASRHEGDTRGRLQKKQRRLMIFVLVVALLWGGLLWLVVSLLPEGESQPEPAPAVSDAELADYVNREWAGCSFVSYDRQTGLAVIRGESSVRYEQARQYGQVYDEMMDSYLTTARGLMLGLQLDCGLEIEALRLDQYSTDGQVIFSVTADGQVERCWTP